MYAGVKFIPMIIVGLASIIWGFPASHRLKSPYDIGAALAVILGLILFLIGILLTSVPHFFR